MPSDKKKVARSQKKLETTSLDLNLIISAGLTLSNLNISS